MIQELGKGKAKAIDLGDYVRLGQELDVEPAVIEALAQAESNGFGWFKDGRIKILFEKHVFFRELVDLGLRRKAVAAKLARPKWISPQNGGYKEQNFPANRYRIFEAAIALDEEAAYRSVSIGRFQIMGFNFRICGYDSAKAMFQAFVQDEENQLQALVLFLKAEDLVGPLRIKDWKTVAAKYNGEGQAEVYAKKLAAAYRKLSRIAGRYDVPATTRPAILGRVVPKPMPPGRTPILIQTPAKPFPFVRVGIAILAIILILLLI